MNNRITYFDCHQQSNLDGKPSMLMKTFPWHVGASHSMATVMLVMLTMLVTGCHVPEGGNGFKLGASKWLREDRINFAALEQHSSQTTELSVAARLDRLAMESPMAVESSVQGASAYDRLASHTSAQESVQLVRGQSQDDNQFSPGGFGFPQGSRALFEPQESETEVPSASTIPATDRGDSTQGSNIGRTAYQFPEFATPDRTRIPGNGLPSPNVGSPNELNPLVQPFERGGNAPIPFPANYADLDVFVTETQTGRVNFGAAYNSDNGIVGQFTIDEKNFDIFRWPRSLREIFVDRTAWRGGGQQFRLELAPGANLERYLVSLTEPYLFGTDYSLSVSGYLFDRNYFDWDEQRLGGRVSIGRRLTPDISVNLAMRMESVTLDNARLASSPTLNDTLGTNNLFIGSAGLVRDTRDSQVNATEGTYLALTASQAFGDFNYTRGDLDFRTYRLLYERPDGSGRHTLSFGTKLGFSGSDTPLFENYFAGGFSTLRGFDFRGAAPLENGVRVGGEFQWLNTIEYMFPITADDMIKGVVFCDFGTVEESIELNSENFRVAPGFGLRIAMPGQAGGAPLAFDFAFPVSNATGDEEQVFSFYLDVLR